MARKCRWRSVSGAKQHVTQSAEVGLSTCIWNDSSNVIVETEGFFEGKAAQNTNNDRVYNHNFQKTNQSAEEYQQMKILCRELWARIMLMMRLPTSHVMPMERALAPNLSKVRQGFSYQTKTDREWKMARPIASFPLSEKGPNPDPEELRKYLEKLRNDILRTPK